MDKSPHKPTVVIGLLGTRLDSAAGEDRWDRWRPSVGLCQQDDLVVSRFELLHGAGEQALVQRVKADIEAISPETKVCPREVDQDEPGG